MWIMGIDKLNSIVCSLFGGDVVLFFRSGECYMGNSN
jgi:hypothetical protein